MELSFLGTISTIIGTGVAIIVLIFTAISLYHTFIERKEKLEDKVKSAFLKKKVWTNEGVVGGADTSFFDLRTKNSSNHIFYGLVDYSDSELNEKKLVFYFDKINRKKITFRLCETIGYRDIEFAKAELQFIHPDLFKITFSKGNIFSKDNFISDLPRTTQIFPSVIDDIENEASNVQDIPSRKILTDEIIKALSPERNYAKVKEILGVPDKVIKDSSVFDNDLPFSIYSKNDLNNIISDIYFLDNAHLKVTTIDRQSIHALTVLSHNELLLPDLPHYGDDKVCQELVDNATVRSIRTMRDSAIALRISMGPPFYKHMTYFIDGYLKDEENPDESELIDSEIVGFCLSESQMAFYIYDYELR